LILFTISLIDSTALRTSSLTTSSLASIAIVPLPSRKSLVNTPTSVVIWPNCRRSPAACRQLLVGEELAEHALASAHVVRERGDVLGEGREARQRGFDLRAQLRIRRQAPDGAVAAHQLADRIERIARDGAEQLGVSGQHRRLGRPGSMRTCLPPSSVESSISILAPSCRIGCSSKRARP
jgi:hypothetical protein